MFFPERGDDLDHRHRLIVDRLVFRTIERRLKQKWGVAPAA